MKKQAKTTLAVCAVAAATGLASAQYMAESQAAINMNNTMNSQMAQPGFGGPPPVPGQVPGVGNPGAGFGAPGMGGNTIPGGDPALMDPALMGSAGYGATGVVATPAATPIPTAQVLTGRRVYDAVSGGLLEDAIEIAVRQSDADAYPDDGIHDNGIASDNIRGNVQTSEKDYIGQFSNLVKEHLIHAVRNAENIDPMIYYGYHVAKIGPKLEGAKRYGLPLPGEQEAALVKNPVKDIPNVLELEDSRDELVRQWNHEFLADYRVTPEDPQSPYYPVFIPAPPLTPVNYPVPNGYVSQQSTSIRRTAEAQASAAAAAATAAQSRSTSRGGGDGGAPAGTF